MLILEETFYNIKLSCTNHTIRVAMVTLDLLDENIIITTQIYFCII